MKKQLVTLACAVAVGASFVAAQAPNREEPPKLGPAPKLSLPSIEKHKLANGLAVWLVESHEVPIAQVNLVVLAGSSEDPAGKYGVASLAAAMLDEGAGTRSSLEIADAVEFLGATLTTGSSFDSTAVRLNTPSARLADALAIMADVSLRPTFPVADLERLRAERLTDLLQAQDDPASVASVAFAKLLFRTHRYGTGANGTATSMKALTADDLRAFHSTWFVPSSSALVVTGDVTSAGVLPLLEKAFGAWKGPAQKRVVPPAAPQVTSREIVIIDTPGAPQSQIRIGRVGVSRSSGDYFPIQVLNTIFGGSFTSRLNQNLREEHGYSYGASSNFDMRLSPGPFVSGAGVQTDKTSEALREFFLEFNKIRQPVGRAELTKAVNYVALGFPGDFETASDISRKIEELVVYGLPDTWFARYMPAVRRVGSEEVVRAALTHLLPSRMLVVVVGDRKVIEPGIRDLTLAPIRHMSVAEVFE